MISLIGLKLVYSQQFQGLTALGTAIPCQWGLRMGIREACGNTISSGWLLQSRQQVGQPGGGQTVDQRGSALEGLCEEDKVTTRAGTLGILVMLGTC